MIVIFHNKDLDGWCSGAILSTKYKGCTLLGYDYGEEIPNIPDNEHIIMVDVSFPIEDMFKIAEKSKSFIWIDHHISKIKQYEEFLVDNQDLVSLIKPVLSNNISACEASWKFCYPDFTMPQVIKLLGMYDTWRREDEKQWNEIILPFQYGMRIKCNSPQTFPLDLFNEEDDVAKLLPIIEHGKLILKYQKINDELSVKKYSFECIFEELRCLCLNTTNFNSNTFLSLYDESKHDIMIAFVFNGESYYASIYTTKEDVDCSELAKIYNGGGHKMASGFTHDNLLDLFKPLDFVSLNQKEKEEYNEFVATMNKNNEKFTTSTEFGENLLFTKEAELIPFVKIWNIICSGKDSL